MNSEPDAGAPGVMAGKEDGCAQIGQTVQCVRIFSPQREQTVGFNLSPSISADLTPPLRLLYTFSAADSTPFYCSAMGLFPLTFVRGNTLRDAASLPLFACTQP